MSVREGQREENVNQTYSILETVLSDPMSDGLLSQVFYFLFIFGDLLFILVGCHEF